MFPYLITMDESKHDKYDLGGLKVVLSVDGIMISYLCLSQV